MGINQERFFFLKVNMGLFISMSSFKSSSIQHDVLIKSIWSQIDHEARYDLGRTSMDRSQR